MHRSPWDTCVQTAGSHGHLPTQPESEREVSSRSKVSYDPSKFTDEPIQKSGPNLVDVGNLTGLDQTDMKWPIEKYLPFGELHILGGRSGAGKTHLLFQILDKCRTIFDPILYVCSDRPAKTYAALFTKLGIEPWPIISLIDFQSDLSAHGLTEHTDNHKYPFHWLSERLEEIREPRPKVVVLDAAAIFVPCYSLNQMASAASGFAALTSLGIREGITFILVWHVSKVKVDDLNDVFDRLTGSHGVQGYTSTKAFLDVEGRYPRLHIRGQHFQDRVVAIKRGDHGSFRLPTRDEIIAMEFPIYQHVPNNPISRADLIELSKAQGAGLRVRTIDRQLKALLRRGLILKPEYGKYSRSPNAPEPSPSESRPKVRLV